MDILIISIIAFLVAILTFFSGFGLGTILTPVFMIFFPVELAIALVGVVHFCNNLFKIILVGKDAVKNVLIKFGIPAVIAAFLGSKLLLSIPDVQPLFSYILFGRQFDVYPVKFIISILLICFALMDLIPRLSKIRIEDQLVLGGFLSGFFGGLSGNQGALRSAFLIRAGLTKEAYIGTAVVVSTCVDFTRLSVYAGRFLQSDLSDHIWLVICATLSAISGAYLGLRLLEKVTIDSLQVLVAILLLGISLALGLGWV